MKILVDEMPSRTEDCQYSSKNNFIDKFFTKIEWHCGRVYDGECPGTDKCPHFTDKVIADAVKG